MPNTAAKYSLIGKPKLPMSTKKQVIGTTLRSSWYESLTLCQEACDRVYHLKIEASFTFDDVRVL